MSVVAVIPARDEADRLPHALAALHAQGVETLVVANGCSDATARVARAHGASVIETPALAGGVGAARAVGLARAIARSPAWLMTTDADCVVAAGTIGVLDGALDHADAAFGRVEPDPVEFARLPLAVRRHGRLEDRRDALRARIEGLRAARDWNPPPHHGQSPGALIAWRPEAYRAVGGIASVPCNEDARMSSALVRAGLRVARPWHAVVRASCRVQGRAPGGMASTIAARTRTDLRAETAALIAECAVLEQCLADLVRHPDRPAPSNQPGGRDVSIAPGLGTRVAAGVLAGPACAAPYSRFPGRSTHSTPAPAFPDLP